jgi:hypothetical protein
MRGMTAAGGEHVGLIVFPYFLLIELLAPVVELVGIVAVVLGLAFGAVNASRSRSSSCSSPPGSWKGSGTAR